MTNLDLSDENCLHMEYILPCLNGKESELVAVRTLNLIVELIDGFVYTSANRKANLIIK